MRALLLLLLVTVSSCYRRAPPEPVFKNDGPYVVLLVDAQHLDYSNAENLFYSIHANSGCTVGHAWFLLSGREGILEGGHSGELGITEPRYLESLFLYKDEPNPVRHLFKSLNDGYFERGAGIHKPTYAIRIELTEWQYRKIRELVDPATYPYSRYSLTDNQCATLVAKIAILAGVPLQHEVTIPIEQTVVLNDEEITLWRDPIYSSITVSTPDILERSMRAAVREGRGRECLQWYKKSAKGTQGTQATSGT